MLRKLFALVLVLCLTLLISSCNNALVLEDTKQTDNSNGKLKIGELNDKIAVGSYHVALVGFDNKVRGIVWEEVYGWEDIIQVSISFDHIVALKKDGTVVAAGSNYFGQCEVSNWTDIVSVHAAVHRTYGVTKSGKILCVGSLQEVVEDSFKNDDYLKVYGLTQTIALRKNGKVDGYEGTEEWSEIIDVAVGDRCAIGLKKDGTVVATEEISEKQRKIIESWRDIVAIESWGEYFVGLKSNGTVVYIGRNYEMSALSGWKDIVGISSGRAGTVGIKSDGTAVIACGGSYQGKNVCDWTNAVDVVAARNFTAMLSNNGTVKSCSSRGSDLCEEWEGITKITCGLSYFVGLTENNTVITGHMVGGNYNREFEEVVGSWNNITDIAVGQDYAIGVKHDGSTVTTPLYYNVNYWGQMNVSGWNNVESIYTSGTHTVGVLADGTVAATGDNQYGQCDVEDWENIKEIYLNVFNTIGITDKGTVMFVGRDTDNCSGVKKWKNIKSICFTGDCILGVKSDGTIVAEGNTETISPEIFEWKNIEKITSCQTHIVGLTKDGTVITNSDNVNGLNYFS